MTTLPRRIGSGYSDLHVDAKEHAKTCHAVFISDGGKMSPVCTDPSRHPEALAKTGTSHTISRHGNDAVQISDADEARAEFITKLFARSPAILVELLPMFIVLIGAQDQHEVNRMLGLPESDRFNWQDAHKRFGEYLAADGNVVDGLPMVNRQRLDHAATAIVLDQLLRECVLNANDDDPVVAYVIRFLKHHGYEPNEAELKLLEETPVVRVSDRAKAPAKKAKSAPPAEPLEPAAVSLYRITRRAYALRVEAGRGRDVHLIFDTHSGSETGIVIDRDGARALRDELERALA